MSKRQKEEPRPLSTGRALRHLLVFQLKLALDALRDLALSPLSIGVFVLDAIRQPALDDSLYVKLMKLGRRSDRLINLFDEYSDVGHFTVDHAVTEVEQALAARREESASARDAASGRAAGKD